MLLEEMTIPEEWSPMDLKNESFKIIRLDPHSFEYQKVKTLLTSVNPFYTAIQGVFRIQNPFLYNKFRLKTYDFAQKGHYEVNTLFHDTSRANVPSIATFNFDWRFGERFMFGPGVYFSINPFLANKHSSKKNGIFRSMFVAQVIMQNIQHVNGEIFLPDYGFDTVSCHMGETIVKYFDAEFYPQYYVDYIGFPSG